MVCHPAAAERRTPLAEAVEVVGAEARCLTQEAVVRRLAEWLGTDTVQSGIAVTLDAEAGTFVVRLPDRADARRVFRTLPEDCAERLDAVTLAIALAIDHTLLERLPERAAAGREPGPLEEDAREGAGTREDGDTPADGGGLEHGSTPGDGTDDGARGEGRDAPATASVDEAPDPAPSADSGGEPEAPIDPAAPSTQAEPAPMARPGAQAEVGAMYDVVPGWSVGVAGGLHLRISGVAELRADVLWSPGGSATLATGRAEYELLAGRLLGCGILPAGPYELRGCVGLGAGRLSVVGRGFDQNATAGQPWVAGVGRAAVALPLAPWAAIGVGVDLVVPLLRPEVVVESAVGTVLGRRALPAVGVVPLLRLSVRLP